MAINYPYYSPQPIYQQRPVYPAEQTQIGIKGRPVSSIEEVRAASIDFDGSISFFPDLANRKIYTKQVNIDGTASLNVYELKNEPVVNSTQFITREEFETAMAKLKEKIAPLTLPQATQNDEQFKQNLLDF